MNPLEFLNNNPALTSLIAFPLGLIILIATGKFFGLGKIYTDAIEAIKDHTAAEVKIESRLSDVVGEIKNLVAANWDNRRFIDEKLEHFDDRLDRIEQQLETIMALIPKRKTDYEAR